MNPDIIISSFPDDPSEEVSPASSTITITLLTCRSLSIHATSSTSFCSRRCRRL
jgi:hypothetical protein